MKNNWALQFDETNNTSMDFDDYGFGFQHPVSIGDEIEATSEDGCFHSGIVIGVIRDHRGEPVCYKIWSDFWSDDGEKTGEGLDYVEASTVKLCEPCGDSAASLSRIGYEPRRGRAGRKLFRNKKTGDVIDAGARFVIRTFKGGLV